MADVEIKDHADTEAQPVREIEAGIAAAFPAHRRLPSLINPNPGFGSSEHQQLGDKLYLWRTPSLDGTWPDFYNGRIRIADGIVLSYGQIVALAGDLYGLPDRPISGGRNASEQRERFLAAFSTLVNCDRAELNAILQVMTEEGAAIQQGLIDGEDETSAFHHENWDYRYALATGYDLSKGEKGRYLDLASNNYDHFGDDAVKAYSAGHGLAIEKAYEAHRYLKDHPGAAGKDRAAEIYEQALAMSAFADHYLTDLFSSGHLRVPRRKLANDWDGWRGYFCAGGLMAKRQHNEDGNFGLFVRDAHGQRWRSFGDEHLSTFAGRDNKMRAFFAIQESMTEVWAAFDSGQKATDYAALRRSPRLDLVQRAESDKNPDNHAALFIYRNNRIEHRYPMSDVDKHHWEPMISYQYPWDEDPERDSALEEAARGGLEWFWDAHFDLPPGPAADLPAPPAPRILGWEDSASTAHGPSNKFRYAQAIAVVRTFADGSSCEYCSNPGPWSDWLMRPEGKKPVIEIAASGVPGVVKRYIIRQYRGYAPRIDRYNETQEGVDVISTTGNTTIPYTDINA